MQAKKSTPLHGEDAKEWIFLPAFGDLMKRFFVLTSCPKARHRIGEGSALRWRRLAKTTLRARHFSKIKEMIGFRKTKGSVQTKESTGRI